jgi:hypothetical protein
VESIANAIGPRDIIEWIIVKDLVDLTYNKLFYRRVIVGIIDVARMPALISILNSILPNPSAQKARKLAKRWFANSDAKSVIVELFIEHKINNYHIDAEAVRLNSQALEQIERMLAGMESRFSLTYREIENYRESLRISAEIENGSEPKRLPYIRASELSGAKQDPEHDERSDNKEGPQESLAVSKPATGWWRRLQRVKSKTRAETNRRNASRSTGPRTAKGRSRSAQNARRHGFASAVVDGTKVSDEAERLARAIAGTDPTPQRLYYARIIAETRFTLPGLDALRSGYALATAVQPRRILILIDAAVSPWLSRGTCSHFCRQNQPDQVRNGLQSEIGGESLDAGAAVRRCCRQELGAALAPGTLWTGDLFAFQSCAPAFEQLAARIHVMKQCDNCFAAAVARQLEVK